MQERGAVNLQCRTSRDISHHHPEEIVFLENIWME